MNDVRLQRRMNRVRRFYGSITDDDPRHGSDAGYTAGCRQACCRRAHARRHKEDRIYPNPLVDATGTHRRIQALARMGYSTAELSRRLGKHRSYILKVLNNDRLQAETATLIRLLYDQLSMTPCTSPTANRTAATARDEGWAEPLDWTDIDDPTESPWQPEPEDSHTRRTHTLGRRTQQETAEDAEWMADTDENLTGACDRLGITPDGLWSALKKAGRLDIYDRLSRREVDGEMRANVRAAKRVA